MVGGAHAEDTAHVVFAGSAANLHVAQPSYAVLAFEPHVHHQLPFEQCIFGVTQVSPVFFLFIYLHLVHHIRRKVLQGNAGITRKEVVPVNEQALYIAAIHIDSSVFPQFHSR